MKSLSQRSVVLGSLISATLLAQVLLPTSIVFAMDETRDQGQYDLTLGNISDNGLMRSVPGCNGITNKVQRTMSSILSTDPNKLIDQINDLSDTYKSFQSLLGDEVTTTDSITNNNTKSLKLDTKEAKFREDCMDGIAYNLTKKQVADITEKTTTWANTGFAGDPMFVRDQTSFYTALKNQTIERSLAPYKNPANTEKYPFGRDFAKSQINAIDSEKNFEESIKSDLTKSLTPGATTKSYATDFSQGGWNGWLSLTQKPQNNPLGFNILATQHIGDTVEKQEQNQRDELNQNNGFLSQKKCVQYDTTTSGSNTSDTGISRTNNDTCIKYEIVTPGSIIEDQLANVLGSPIRQLELAKGVNESLNGVFSKLLSKLQSQGLSGITSSSNTTGGQWETFGNAGINRVYDTSGNDITGTSYDETGKIITVNKGNGWNSEGDVFDLTKDLGNRYISPIYAGQWDAKNNITAPANTSIAPSALVPGEGQKNNYWIVSTAGNTSLFSSTHSWKKGDRAFFDGESWRLGTPSYAIEKKGVIQIQKEYIDAVKQSLELLPKIVPAIGKLDHCIPGPNPSWQRSTALTLDAFTSYLEAMYMDDNGQIIKPDPSVFEKQFNGVRPWNNLNSTNIGTFNMTPGQRFVAFTDKYYEFQRRIPVIGNIIADAGRLSRDIFVGFLDLFGFGSKDKSAEEKRAEAIAQARSQFEFEKKYQVDRLKWQFSGAGNNSYSALIKNRYGEKSPMLTDTYDGVTQNPAYLPMAGAGMSLTRNIKIYELNIDIATAEYNDLISISQSNIYRLNLVKTKVDKIISAAQKRREKDRMEKGLPTIPRECLNLESISIIDGRGTVRNTIPGAGMLPGDLNGSGVTPVKPVSTGTITPIPGVGTTTGTGGSFQNPSQNSNDISQNNNPVN